MLKSLAENSIDSLVTDPPYGIRFMGKAWDGADIVKHATKEMRRGRRLCADGKWRNERLDLAKEAGKYDRDYEAMVAFEIWTKQWAAEAFRVLKPGAHALVFAAPRSYHRMACGMEDAGFEVRDQIQWLFGQGFPKSLNISKAIDRAAGAEREVTHFEKRPVLPKGRGNGRDENGRPIEVGLLGASESHQLGITAPATDDAKEWSGWGTALKPANEPILLARKPISEKTVAANVLKWGTGGLNIDGCRVESADQATLDAAVKRMTGNKVRQGGSKQQECIRPNSSQGRFPANLIFSHTPYCTDEMCDITCAIKVLDEQTKGLHGAGSKRKGGESKQDESGSGGLFGVGVHEGNGMRFGDSGSASRFFYCAKVSPGERNAGLDKFDSIEIDTIECNAANTELATSILRVILESIKSLSIAVYGARITAMCPKGCSSIIRTTIQQITGSKIWSWLTHSLTSVCIPDAPTNEVPGINLALCVEKLRELTKQTGTSPGKDGSLITDAAHAIFSKLSSLGEESAWQPLKCTHPTLKPLKLMRYLCRLVTPLGGTILDPFLGSGTTGLAAKQEGFEFIGIEKEVEYAAIAQCRIGDRVEVIETAKG